MAEPLATPPPQDWLAEKIALEKAVKQFKGEAGGLPTDIVPAPVGQWRPEITTQDAKRAWSAASKLSPGAPSEAKSDIVAAGVRSVQRKYEASLPGLTVSPKQIVEASAPTLALTAKALDLVSPSAVMEYLKPTAIESVHKFVGLLDLFQNVAGSTATGAAGALLPEPTKEGDEPTAKSLVGDYLQEAAGWTARINAQLDASQVPVLKDWTRAPWDQGAELPGEKSTAAKAYEGIVSPLVSKTLGVDPFKAVLFDELTSEEKASWQNAGKRLYESYASGEQYAKMPETQGWVPLPWSPFEGASFDVKDWRFSDVTDALMPINEARDIKEQVEAQGGHASPMLEVFASPIKRELMNFSGEFVLDPLNLAGPGAGVKIVEHLGKKFLLDPQAVRAAARISQQLSETGIKLSSNMVESRIIQAVTGSPEEKAKALTSIGTWTDLIRQHGNQVASEAEAFARRAKDPEEAIRAVDAHMVDIEKRISDAITDYQKQGGNRAGLEELKQSLARAQAESAQMVTAKAAEDWLKTNAKNLSRRAGQLQDVAGTGETLLRDIAQGTTTLTPKWGPSVHLPFSSSTYSLSSLGRAIERVPGGEALKGGLVRKIDDASKWYDDVLSVESMERRAQELSKAGVPREAFPYWLDAALKSSATFEQFRGASLRSLDIASDLFGSRFRQPGTVSAQLILDAKALAPEGKLEKVRNFVNVRRQDIVKRVAPGLWGEFQNAVSKFETSRAQAFNRAVADFGIKIAKLGSEVYRARKEHGAKIAEGYIERATRLQGKLSGMSPVDQTRARMNIAKFRALADEAETWSKPVYTEQVATKDLITAFEQGKGRVIGPELLPAVQAMDELMAETATALGKSYEETAQYAVAIARHGAGDKEIHEAVGKALYDSTLARGTIETERTLVKESLERLVPALADQKQALATFIQSYGHKKFAKLLIEVRNATLKTSSSTADVMEKAIKTTLVRMLGPSLAEDAIRMAGLQANMKDGTKALSNLAEIVHLDSQKAGRTLESVIAGLEKQALRQAKTLYRVNDDIRAGRKVDLSEIYDEAMADQLKKSVASAKKLVAEEDWPAFFQWYSQYQAPGVARRGWDAAAKHMDQATLAIEASRKRDSAIRAMRATWGVDLSRALPAEIAKDALRVALAGTARPLTQVERVNTVYQALRRSLPNPTKNRHMENMTLDMARTLERKIMAGEPIGAELSSAKARAEILFGLEKQDLSEAKKLLDKEATAYDSAIETLKKNEHEIKPHIGPPPIEGATRQELTEWQTKLQTDMRKVVEGLNEDDQMLVLMSALRMAPDLPIGYSDDLKNWSNTSGISLLGARLSDADPTIIEQIDQVRSIIKSYEQRALDAGVAWVKSPARLMYENGVIEWFPHVSGPENKALKGGTDVLQHYYAGLELPRQPGSNKISLRVDQAKQRTIAGTIREINARVVAERGLDLGSEPTFTFELDEIANKLIQREQAFATKDLLYALVDGGVAKMLNAGEALGEDFIPLFVRSPELEKIRQSGLDPANLFGSRDMFLKTGLPVSEIKRLAEEQRKFIETMSHDAGSRPFGGLILEVEDIRSAHSVEAAVLALRSDQKFWGWDPNAALGVAMKAREEVFNKTIGRISSDVRQKIIKASGLDDPKSMATAMMAAVEDARNLDAWRMVAKDLSRDSGIRVTGEMLNSYYTTDRKMTEAGRSLCIPRAVAQALSDMAPKAFPGEGTNLGWLAKEAFLGINGASRWWRTRILTMVTAYHGRNAIGNTYSRAIDEGLLAAINPIANYGSARVTVANAMANKFGSLAEAQRVLKAEMTKLRPGEEALTRAADVAKWRAMWDAWRLDDAVRHGFDMGDGVVRKAEDVLKTLRDHDVLSGNLVQLEDLRTLQVEQAGAFGNPFGWKQKLEQIASTMEDTALWSANLTMTVAIGAIPTVLPKTVGATIGQFIEQQARVANFMTNFRKTGNVALASDHVRKYLFNFSDLTQTQRTWMRFMFPFFTWQRGNVALHMSMLRDNPVFYNRLNHAFNESIPAALYGEQQAQDNQHTFFRRTITAQDLAQRPEWEQAKFRVPIPEWLGGSEATWVALNLFGAEAFVNNIAPLGAMWRAHEYPREALFAGGRSPLLPWIGQSQFMGQYMLTKFMDQDPITGKPFYMAGSDATTLWELQDSLARRGGPIGLEASFAIQNAFELLPPTPESKARAGNVDLAFKFQRSPFSRHFSSALAAVDMRHLESGVDYGGIDGYAEVPVSREVGLAWKLMSLYAGIKIVQQSDPKMYQMMVEVNKVKAVSREGEALGILQKSESYTPR
jgi:hypothetical protein